MPLPLKIIYFNGRPSLKAPREQFGRVDYLNSNLNSMKIIPNNLLMSLSQPPSTIQMCTAVAIFA